VLLGVIFNGLNGCTIENTTYSPKTDSIVQKTVITIICYLFGAFFFLLGIIGVFLPIMPTVPFMLLSVYCFARSSPRLHNYLRKHPWFGPGIRDWEQNRCIPYYAKLWAIFVITTIGSGSVVFLITERWLQITGIILMLTGLVIITLLKVCPRK
jgi:uncharacterized membrane protein YbaN (DUF454 family)